MTKPDISKDTYLPVRFQLVKWNESCDRITQESKADIFKIILNTSK